MFSFIETGVCRIWLIDCLTYMVRLLRRFPWEHRGVYILFFLKEHLRYVLSVCVLYLYLNGVVLYLWIYTYTQDVGNTNYLKESFETLQILS